MPIKQIRKLLCITLVLALLPASAALADLQPGDEGPEVYDLQLMLFECGWLFELPDGVFGKKTETAVKDYEAYAGLDVDGIADDAMIEHLTEDWIRIMNENSQWTAGAEGMYPAFCNHWNMQDGNSELDYCETHMQLHYQAYQLMSTGNIDDAKQACELWYEEIIRLYDLWYALADEPEKDSVLAARALYLSSMEAHRVAIDSWYASFQTPVSPEQIEYALELPLREHAAWLCALLSGSIAAGSDHE